MYSILKSECAIIHYMAKLAYLVQDLLFVSKIRETAQQLGIEVTSATGAESLLSAAQSAQLVIVDLRRPDALAALDLLSAHAATQKLRLVGFIDHLDVRDSVKEELKAITPFNYTGK